MDFFERILFMSLTGGIMIIVVLFIRPLLKRWRTHKVVLLMWLVTCIMLLTPMRLPSPISIYHNFLMFSVRSPINESTVIAFYDGHRHVIFNSNDATTIGLPSHLLVIWLTGVLLALIYAAFSVWQLHWQFLDAVPRPDLDTSKVQVFVSPLTHSPLTYGIFRPRIILPMPVIEEGALEYIIMHELEHIRSRDALVNFLWILAVSFHWFNPLVWLGWFITRRDMETRCDTEVLRQVGREERIGYAQTLLNMVPVKQMVFPLAFGSSSAGERIRRALSYRPATKRAVCAAIAVFVLCIALFSSNSTRAAGAETTRATQFTTVIFYAQGGD